MKLRKISALALATVMTISTFAIFTSAADNAVQLPANINGEAKYATKTVVNFDEADIETRISGDTNRGGAEVVATGGASGKALKMTSKTGTAEFTVSLGEQDWSAYDGLLYYVDMSGVELEDGKTTAGTGIRVTSLMGTLGLTRNDKALASGVTAFDTTITAYYLDADGTWKTCDDTLRNGERTQYPDDFKGWVYVPFSSYISHNKSWQMTGKGIPDSYAIVSIMFLSGPYKNGGSLIVDDVQLVKNGMTNQELEDYLASQNPPAEENPPADNNDVVDNNKKDTEKADETTAAATDAATTEAETEESGGCGSSITGAFAVVAGVALAGTTVAVKKRRKED